MTIFFFNNRIEDKAKYFSIQKKYCSILNSACKVLWNQYPKLVHKMLKKLLKMKDDYIYLAGKWYYLMALIEERFFKKPLQVRFFIQLFANLFKK